MGDTLFSFFRYCKLFSEDKKMDFSDDCLVFHCETIRKWLANFNTYINFYSNSTSLLDFFSESSSNCTSQRLIHTAQLWDIPAKTVAYPLDISAFSCSVARFDTHHTNVIEPLNYGTQYICKGLNDIFMASLDYLFSQKKFISVCENCKHYFITNKKSDEKYCLKQSPQYENKNCKEAMRLIKQKEREKKDVFKLEHKRIYNKLYQRNQKNSDIARNKQLAQDLFDFTENSHKYKVKLKNKECSNEDYLNWLLSFAKDIAKNETNITLTGKEKQK